MSASSHTTSEHKPRYGAVGVLVEEQGFLVIRRSLTVRAPGLICFPGGTIEVGESAEEAVIRELKEELHLEVANPRLLWQSLTAWGTHLNWLIVDRASHSVPHANPAEVSEYLWIDAEALLTREDLLASVPDFFAAWACQSFELPRCAGPVNPSWKEFARTP